KGSHREQPQCDRNQARPPDRGYAPPKITDDRIRYAPERDRSLSQTKRTERTTARKQIETMVRGGCYRDGKDSFDFVCSRGGNRRSLALSGNMARQPDPVLGSGSHIETDRDPVVSSRVPLPDSWRVLKTRKDSYSHPPSLPGGGPPVCTGPDFPIQQNPKSADFSSFFYFHSPDCLSQTGDKREIPNSQL